MKVDWPPVGCAQGYLYQETSSTGVTHIWSMDRNSSEFCVHLPNENLVQFYTEEYGIEPRCTVAPSKPVCGVTRVRVRPWRSPGGGGERELGPGGELEVDTCTLQAGEEVPRREVTFVGGVLGLYSSSGLGGKEGVEEEVGDLCEMGSYLNFCGTE